MDEITPDNDKVSGELEGNATEHDSDMEISEDNDEDTEVDENSESDVCSKSGDN